MVGLQRHNSAYTARVVRTARDCRGRNLPWGSPARFRGRWDCFESQVGYPDHARSVRWAAWLGEEGLRRCVCRAVFAQLVEHTVPFRARDYDYGCLQWPDCSSKRLR